MGRIIAVARLVRADKRVDRAVLGLADLDLVVVRVGDVKVSAGIGEPQAMLEPDGRAPAILVAELEEALADDRPHGRFAACRCR